MFVVLLAMLSNVSEVNAQITNSLAFDRGPRNPGTVAFTAAGAPGPNCPLNANGTDNGPVKFPVPGNNCVDIDQPPAPSGNPPADGAGNLIFENVNPGAAFNFATQPLTFVWFQAISIFETVASVKGTITNEPMPGLGPSFNSNSCVSCHAAPAVGGSSAGTVSIPTKSGTTTTFTMPLEPVFTGNPELIAATDQNATNQNPQFPSGSSFTGPGFPEVPVNGPSIEVRFVKGLPATGNAAAVQPNDVGNLFTFQGRNDEPLNCSISQLGFTTLGPKTISFRIPTPTFGAGLIENTPEFVLQANLAFTSTNSTIAAEAAALGITGGFNRSGNDGTITRFGWKAQNKSLLIFSGEALNVETGITNEMFTNERTWGSGANCVTNNQPEDEMAPPGFPPAVGDPSVISSSAENMAVFMRLNGAPSQCDAVASYTLNPYGTPGVALCGSFGSVASSDVLLGQQVFNNGKVGCFLCHTPTQTTGPSPNAGLSNQTYHPYSDFAIHTMAPTLADGITQGSAGPSQFRTAPLWGLGQRIFFLHDGRDTDLINAITDHCPTPSSTGGGEACGSVAAFNSLTTAQQQALIDFLRSL
jgi:CxxC motif-containing protein (DUF1111 family)